MEAERVQPVERQAVVLQAILFLLEAHHLMDEAIPSVRVVTVR